MPKRLLNYLFLLFCSSCLLACTTQQLLHPSSIPAHQSKAWLEQIRIGDTLEIIRAEEKKPLTLKVKEINSTSIVGDKGNEVEIDKIVSVEKVEISWLKTSLLVTAIVLVAAAISFKNTIDDIDLDCNNDCSNQ